MLICRFQNFYKFYIVFTLIVLSELQEVKGFFGPFGESTWLYEYVADKSCSTFSSECCRSPFIRKDSAVRELQRVLKDQYFGQHIAVQTVLTALNAHLKDDKPKKPLVFSFHGWVGSGKTYLSELIVKALFKKGSESNYVRIYTASYHFPDKKNETVLAEYQEKLQREIKETLMSCEHAVIIFDEVDVTPPKLYDSLVAFLDRLNTVGGVNHKKAIYIFLSNIGAYEIARTSLNAWKDGIRREDLSFNDFHETMADEAFKTNNSGMTKTRMIERVLVDFFIPFLPMERRHVIECAKVEIKRHGSSITPESIADQLTYWPPDVKLYSQTGCKRVESLAKYVSSADELRKEL